MDDQDKARGFGGLSKLVSDLSDLPRPEPVKEESNHQPATPQRETTTTPAQSGSWVPEEERKSEASSGGSLNFPGLIISGFVLLLIVGAVVSKHQDRQSAKSGFSGSEVSSELNVPSEDSQQPTDLLSDTQRASELDSPPMQSSTQTNTASSAISRFRAEVPPISSNHVHSTSEIRWCLREGIRIDAVRSLNETQADVSKFNRLVDNYNSRCGSYRYRQGSLASAKRDVEPYRSQIRKDARQAATAEKKPATASLTKKIQLALQSLGYKPGPADGIYGSNTADAVEQYQRENNLRVTGKVSEELLEQLKFTEAMR